MRAHPWVRTLVVVLATAVTGGLGVVVSTQAHEDTGGPQRVDDSVKITEVTALTDQDDGVNGESEYCLKISMEHPDHIAASESVDCPSGPNWDDTEKESGKKWEELGRLPLIGAQGYAGTA